MEKAVEEYEDSGTFPILPASRRRRPSKDQVTDWLTWGVRLTIIGLCTLAYRQEQAIQETLQETQTTLQLTQITIAKMSVQQDMQTKQLDEHQRQLQGLWEQIRNNP
jgi:hypothetical protein